MKAFRRLCTALVAVLAALLIGPVGSVQAETRGVDAVTRLQIQHYALQLADTPYTFPFSDCTYFTSMVLWQAGIAPTDDWTPNSSDTSKLASKTFMNPGPTKAAASANDFVDYVTGPIGIADRQEISYSDNTAGGAMLGDILAWDWDGPADGTIDHIAIVTGFTDDAYPLVTQHSPTRINRGWSWDTGAGDWIENSHPGSKAYLIHLS